ncbi:BPTI/Kunitz domain-containing protein-like [Emydura macquarii macquarii]|uniref:BPTI/Kunitz domain-containing protein-like n=1 Tax=Emydura macquarii macquarii TaxID=1129001 RepID=UPI00352AC144
MAQLAPGSVPDSGQAQLLAGSCCRPSPGLASGLDAAWPFPWDESCRPLRRGGARRGNERCRRQSANGPALPRGVTSPLAPSLCSASPDFCQLSPDTGPCKAWVPRLFYNATARQCELFIYGGCQGNRNKFETEEECLQACGPDGICKLPPEAGPCDGALPRFFYRAEAGRCERFTYGGCEGNGNNFETETTCLQACTGHGTA